MEVLGVAAKGKYSIAIANGAEKIYDGLRKISRAASAR
jgi:hypothetical protein